MENTRQYVVKQVNAILLNSTFADTIDPMAKVSDIITFPEDVDLIKERIRDRFHLDIKQDISKMTVNQLHTMLFLFFCNSPKMRNARSTRKPADADTAVQTDIPEERKWTRRTIFGYIIGNIRTAYGRPVQSTEKIGNLIREAYDTGIDPNPLIAKLKELETFFDIKIDYEMRIHNIGSAAEQSFVKKGLAVDTKVLIADMEPLWATIYTALSINFWQSIVQKNLGVRISQYKLSHVKSYDEFVRLVNEAKNRKSR